MAQGYQDLTGQIIRGVISLVGELETMLGQLVRLSNGDETVRALRTLTSPAQDLSRGVGPTVPGVAGAPRGQRPGRHRRAAQPVRGR